MDKGFLEECLAKGLSLDSIGQLAGKHPSTVGYWLKKHGLTANGAARHTPKGGLTREELEPLVNEGLTIEGVAQRLGIGDTTVRHWLKRHGLKTHRTQRRTTLTDMRRTGQREVDAECRKYGLTRHVSVASERRLRCSKCRAEAVSRRRRKVKEMLVAEAGGRCAICGYARNPAALQFHHVDPASKSFGLGVRGITRSIERLRAEAAKCVLLCANCHAEVEVGAVELSVKSETADASPG
jgi:excisionase family DNA binding protein